MTDPHIRPARPGDGAGCAEVWIDTGRYYHALEPGTFQIPSRDGLADSFERDIADVASGRLYLVAEVGATVAGLLIATLHEPGPHPEHALTRDRTRPRLFVDLLAVAGPHRRSGVGTALMTAAETWAADHGATTISLDTYLHSPLSVPFYENRMHYARRAVAFRKELGPRP